MEASNQFDELVALVKTLREECPWDRKQTHESIKDNLIEEAYELVSAIDEKDSEEMKKELGDLLLHVLFHSRMAEENSTFTIEDVIFSLSEKLIRRHPHVFDSQEVADEKEVAENWETIKLKEGKQSILDNLPESLPALIRSQRMQEKASNVGFDWSNWELAWNKFEEELGEWNEAVKDGRKDEMEKEFGDLLFSLVNVGRLLGIQAEDSLRQTNHKFLRRFQFIEKRLRDQDKRVEHTSLDEMDTLWDEAKRKGY